jgi:hypothetical protein
MLRPTLLASSLLFLLGCASARTNDLVHGSYDVRANAPSLDADHPGTTATLGGELARPEAASTEPAPAPTTLSAVPQEGESLHGSRFTLKGGYYGATEDALDDGYIFGVSWMRFFTRIFALELEVDYLDADGSDAGADFDVWSVPLMVNGRFNVPLWILDLYAGAGVGTFYYDAEASGAVSGSDDGFIWAGDAFLGATINLADRIALGLEGKYYLTDDIDPADEGLDAYTLMLTLGFSQ